MLKAIEVTAVGTLLIATPFKALAQTPEARKLTYLTFTKPIQLPGFELPAGKYRFSLADPDTSRRVVEVANEDGTKTYGFLLTIPDERLKPAKDALVLFNETEAGTPAAVRAWFYPGESLGYEMVYPKNQAVKIAKATHGRVLATESDTQATGGDRVRAIHGAKVGRVDENGNFSSDDTRATSGRDKGKEATDKDNDRKKLDCVGRVLWDPAYRLGRNGDSVTLRLQYINAELAETAERFELATKTRRR
jgi:hypothetical protein